MKRFFVCEVKHEYESHGPTVVGCRDGPVALLACRVPNLQLYPLVLSEIGGRREREEKREKEGGRGIEKEKETEGRREEGQKGEGRGERGSLRKGRGTGKGK